MIRHAAPLITLRPWLCNFSDEKPATLFCADCNHDMCVDCSKAAHAMKVLSKHKVVDLAQKASVAGPPLCEVHKGRHKDLYCNECKVHTDVWGKRLSPPS